MAGEYRGIDNQVAGYLTDPLLAQFGNHIAQLLAGESRVAAEAGHQITLQYAVLDRPITFQGGGETIIRAQLQ